MCLNVCVVLWLCNFLYLPLSISLFLICFDSTLSSISCSSDGLYSRCGSMCSSNILALFDNLGSLVSFHISDAMSDN